MSIDNEREALAGVIRDADMMLPAGSLALVEWSMHLAGSILAAGFRGSEVPEPSVEGVAAEHQRHADARRAETMTLISHAEPQGEPSDAKVQAALEAAAAHYATTWVGGITQLPVDFDAMRAALRAASAVTEQGENRHG